VFVPCPLFPSSDGSSSLLSAQGNQGAADDCKDGW
jgi:hypothetical protein